MCPISQTLRDAGGWRAGAADLVLRAELPHAHQVAWVRNNNARFALNRFYHEPSNIWILKSTLQKKVNTFGSLPFYVWKSEITYCTYIISC